MHLYTTELLIEDIPIPYEVYKEGSRMFFKPLKSNTGIDAPIFWVAEINGEWQPININDEIFIKQVQEDILKHNLY